MKNNKHNFDEAAITWDENPGRVKLANEIADVMIKLVNPSLDMDIMDFGCGTGLISFAFQPLVHSITGIDSSRGMLEVFNSKADKLGLDNISSIFVDSDEGNELAGSFDIILSSMVFHHIKDIKSQLDRFYAILKPGGILCIADLDLEEGKFHNDNTGIYHFGFDRKELGRLFEDAGFTAVESIDATEMEKTGADGITRSFPIFAIQGSR